MFLRAIVFIAACSVVTCIAAPSIRPDGATVYTAKWCGPCKKYKPTLDRLIAEGYRIKIVDIDTIPAGGYRPKMVPETCFFSGTKLRSKVSGIIGYHILKLRMKKP